MAEVLTPRKNLSINPLKMSPPLGGSLAFMGLDGCVPLIHGSQGCSAFGLAMAVLHYRETIPFQNTAMSEVTTILGGVDNLEEACLNIVNRTKCRIIGICTTGLTETRGEDLKGDLRHIRRRHPELADVELVYVSTPDFVGGLQTGWSKAVSAMVDQIVLPPTVRRERQINILAGNHLTAGDIEEIRDLVEAFGLTPIVLPDLSNSLDGQVPDRYIATTYGGTTVDDIRAMGNSAFTIGIGEQMTEAARILQTKTGVPFEVLDRLTGLVAVDRFVALLQRLSGQSAPERVRKQRRQLVDAMLDGHFYFSGIRVAVAADPDLLFAMASWLGEMGATVVTAVSSVETPVLAGLAVDQIVIGDMDDLERGAEEQNADLLIAHSHGRMAAERLGLPLYRVGFPMFDRLGANHRRTVGYRATRDLIFELGNLIIEHTREAEPGAWTLPGEDNLEEGGHAPATSH
ncbi:MAG TPA: nitrogenase iron-molybdenum cofactor biosynthesis protein NifN [Telmatospirillum sp.]|nr:nitrogenase iron-molybdenum cofactor biosynthesis protein NifN [Telmatospirillum sp.]